MQINNFSELSQFIYEEYDKMSETFNLVNPSTDFIKYVEKSLKKYTKLYNKPLFKRAKIELQIQSTINTMPHGKIWQFFHKKLWLKVQDRLQEAEKVKKEPNIAPCSSPLYPQVMKNIDLPQVSDLNDEESQVGTHS